MFKAITRHFISLKSIIAASLLIAGNVLGVGVLALPIKSGLAGFFPALVSILLIWFLMLISSFVILNRLPIHHKHFDIPSFYHREMGKIGYFLAIICNLIILYGVIVAYLSGMTILLMSSLPLQIPPQIITLTYALLVTGVIISGLHSLIKGNMILLIALLISFIVLAFSSTSHFSWPLLTYHDWKFAPFGFGILVSAFHFHNIIPTVSHALNKNQKATQLAITIGMVMGLFINLSWLFIVTGSLPVNDATHLNLIYAFFQNFPATIPMAHLLHSRLFTEMSLTFGVFAITASYIANGTGLFGFIRDMTTTYLKTDKKWVVSLIAFAPPITIALIYPKIFLYMLDIVGGIGETILFLIFPGIILLRLGKNKWSIRRHIFLKTLGYIMFFTGCCILLLISFDKIGLLKPSNFLQIVC